MNSSTTHAEPGIGRANTVARLRDGTSVSIRAIHETDVELERKFIESMSPASRRFRFLDTIRTPTDALLKQMTSIDHATDAAYIAVIGSDGEEIEIGVGRFSALPGGGDCEFAVAVTDEWQRKGLGTLLMERLVAVARSRGIAQMHSSDMADNSSMRKFAEHLHFEQRRDPQDATHVLYSVDLTPR